MERGEGYITSRSTFYDVYLKDSLCCKDPYIGEIFLFFFLKWFAHLGTDGMKAIFEAVQANDDLQFLDISNIPIDKSLRPMLSALRQSKYGCSLQLFSLYVLLFECTYACTSTILIWLLFMICASCTYDCLNVRMYVLQQSEYACSLRMCSLFLFI